MKKMIYYTKLYVAGCCEYTSIIDIDFLEPGKRNNKIHCKSKRLEIYFKSQKIDHMSN